jgi:hypothetical protein
MTTTTQSTGVDSTAAALSIDEDGAAEQFLSRWSEEDPEEVSESPEDEEVETDDEPVETEAEEDEENEEETEADPEETGDESDTDDEEDSDEVEEEPKKKGKTLDDDAVVKVKVDDKELEVSVKDLKRLYGQEAALTKKSQAVATERKEVEANGAKLAAQMQRVYDKAAARWEPYSKIDMLVASKQLDTEEFAALRQEAQAAFEDFRFITQEADEFVKNANEQRQATLKTEAKKAVEVLKTAIPGWNQAMYDSVRTYAIDKGLPADVVNAMVDPVAIQLIHKAMTFDKAKTITTKKKTVQPKKVLKTTKTTTGRDVKEDRTAAQMKRLKASGTTDDAADLFLARWAQD